MRAELRTPTGLRPRKTVSIGNSLKKEGYSQKETEHA